jgi:hypothetical protein
MSALIVRKMYLYVAVVWDMTLVVRQIGTNVSKKQAVYIFRKNILPNIVNITFSDHHLPTHAAFTIILSP